MIKPINPPSIEKFNQSIKNIDIQTAIKESVYLDGYSDIAPSKVEELIRLCVDITPNNYRKTICINTDSYGVDATKDFYISGYSYCCGALGIGASSAINVQFYQDGILQTLFQKEIQAGTSTDSIAFSGEMTFKNPIKVDSGTSITMNNSSNNKIWLYGYYVDRKIYDTGVKQ